PGAPTRINEFGVPVGYPRTEAGAVSACGNYVSAYSDVRNREPSRIRELFQSIALSSNADSLADQIIAVDESNAQQYQTSSVLSPEVNFNVRVAGYSLDSYSDDEAVVTVWGISSFGIYGRSDRETAPRQGWGTDECNVSWQDEDWRIVSAGDGPGGPEIIDRDADNFGRFILLGAEG
nr:hypothetical protein [Micromonospora sp. DSM 115978]